jgi:hypothetical protein
MTSGSADPVSFLWLRDLAINDQVALLRYPRRTISAEVARQIAAILGVSVVVFHLRGPSDRWTLSEAVASQLSHIREKLDKWWNSDALTNGERRYLIEHRADPALTPSWRSKPAAPTARSTPPADIM